MSICNSLVRRMSGKIQVASRVGVGTSIRVTLPLELCVLPPTPPKLPRPVRRVDASEPTASLPPPKPDVGSFQKLAVGSSAPPPAPPSPIRSTASLEPPSPETVSSAASAVFSAGSKATTPATPPPASSADGFKVLVIDDNPISRTTMTALLKKKGVPHLSAVDGYDGLAKYKQHLPALIWLDHEMPASRYVLHVVAC